MDGGGRNKAPAEAVEAILDVRVRGELGRIEQERVCVWVCMLEKVANEVFLDFSEERRPAVGKGRGLRPIVFSRMECV